MMQVVELKTLVVVVLHKDNFVEYFEVVELVDSWLEMVDIEMAV